MAGVKVGPEVYHNDPDYFDTLIEVLESRARPLSRKTLRWIEDLREMQQQSRRLEKDPKTRLPLPYRERWYAPSLAIIDEPLIKSLREYRLSKDRWLIPIAEWDVWESNLYSSRQGGTRGKMHLPVLDIDVPVEIYSPVAHPWFVSFIVERPTRLNRIFKDAFPSVWRSLFDNAHRGNSWASYSPPHGRRPDGLLEIAVSLPEGAHLEPSSTSGHTHLYIDIPLTRWQWFRLNLAAALSGVVEREFFIWSLRRGANFVRQPGVTKDPATSQKPEAGWFFRRR